IRDRIADRDRSRGSRHDDHLLRWGCGVVAAWGAMSLSLFVHALGLGLDPAWRRQTRDERCRSADDFCGALSAESDVTTFTYSMVGLKDGVDVMLCILVSSAELVEDILYSGQRTGVGRLIRR